MKIELQMTARESKRIRIFEVCLKLDWCLKKFSIQANKKIRNCYYSIKFFFFNRTNYKYIKI